MGAPSPNQGEVRDAPASWRALLGQIGPGIIIAGSIVGSGELIATTKVGAEAGIWLLWLIVLGCVIKVFTQVEIGRHTIVHGETPLEALNKIPGPRLRINWLVALVAVMTCLIITQQGGIVGGVGQALSIAYPLTDAGSKEQLIKDAYLQERLALSLTDHSETPAASGTRQRIADLERRTADLPVSPDAHIWAALVALLTSILLYFGRYRFIQAFAMTLVGLFSVVTVASVLFLQMTDWALPSSDLIDGLRFQVPPESDGVQPITTALAAFGIIGLGAAELLMYPYWCLEKGYARWTGARIGTQAWIKRARGWIRVLHADAWLSMIVYTAATVAFYVLGAAVLGRSGLNPSGSEMVRTLSAMYVPVFGPWARPVFLIGATAVLYSTFFVAAASMSRLVADLLGQLGWIGKSEASRMLWTRRIGVAWPIVALLLLFSFQSPVAMVLASGTVQACMLPLLGGSALYFRYRRGLATLRPKRAWDVFLWLSFAGLLLAGGWTIGDLLFG